MSEPTLIAESTGGPDANPEGMTAAGGQLPERIGSLASDAWRDLRRSPLFIAAAVLIILVILISLFPGLFTHTDPLASDLNKSDQGPSAQAWFGYDLQGHDVYSRVIYGARYSVIVGIMATLGTTLIGVTVGITAAYYGRWLDGLLSRIGDVFLGIPFLLGAIVILTTSPAPWASCRSSSSHW
jgi:oligopeptide transport system permease protein